MPAYGVFTLRLLAKRLSPYALAFFPRPLSSFRWYVSVIARLFFFLGGGDAGDQIQNPHAC